MGIKGVRILTFSPFEMKAFGGFYYEMKKKIAWHSTNIASTYSSMIPIFFGTYLLIKWAEDSYHHKVRAPHPSPSSCRGPCTASGGTLVRLTLTVR